MPFKDRERRRRYNTAYKRRIRMKQAHVSAGFKAYICPSHPFLNLGSGLRFENGFLVTSDPELQNLVEADFHFWRQIFPVALDFSSIPRLDD